MFRVALPWESTWGTTGPGPHRILLMLAAAVVTSFVLSGTPLPRAEPAVGWCSAGNGGRDLDAVTCLGIASTRARLAQTGLNSVFSQIGVGNPSILRKKGREICIQSLTRV